MSNEIDWTQATTDTWGEDAIEKTPWIKLEDDVPFVGTLTMVKPGQVKFDKPVVQIYFDDDGMERYLDASVAIMKQFIAKNPKVGDRVMIVRTRELATDQDGSPVMAQNPETGEMEQRSFMRYTVEIATGTAPVKAAPKKAAPKAEKDEASDGAEPESGEPEINLDDIPFG